VDKVLAFLKSIEWAGGNLSYVGCPICSVDEGTEHLTTCELNSAIKELEDG